MLQGTFWYIIHVQVYSICVTIQTCPFVFVIVFETENTIYKTETITKTFLLYMYELSINENEENDSLYVYQSYFESKLSLDFKNWGHICGHWSFPFMSIESTCYNDHFDIKHLQIMFM